MRVLALPPTGAPIRAIMDVDVKRLGRADFATDGKRIYFTIGTWESDVGVLELKK
jgi:hypothetical protein